jgi:hypothetical protein
MKEKLISLLQNLHTDKYSKKEKLEIIRWANNNNDVSIPLFEKYQPNYIYFDFSGEWSIKGFTLINDLKLHQ